MVNGCSVWKSREADGVEMKMPVFVDDDDSTMDAAIAACESVLASRKKSDGPKEPTVPGAIVHPALPARLERP